MTALPKREQMSDLTEALERVFPIWSAGGLSGAMYSIKEGDNPDDTDGFAVDIHDWPIIESAARKYDSLTSPETIEKGVAAAHSVVLLTDDGREISVGGLLTLDHPELLEAVVEAVLRAVREDTE